MTTESDLETLALELDEIRDRAREELAELRSEVRNARQLRRDLEADRRQLEKDRRAITDHINSLFDNGLETIANAKCEEMGHLLGIEADRIKRELHDIFREIARSLTGTRDERARSLHKLIEYAKDGGLTAKDMTTTYVEKQRSPARRPPSVVVRGKGRVAPDA